MEHAGPHRGALAAVRHREQLHLAGDVLGSGPDQGGRPVGGPVVHDQDVDGLRQRLRPRPAVAGLLTPAVQVAEQLVEGRAQPGLLVVGRQDDGEGGLGHRPQSRSRWCVL